MNQTKIGKFISQCRKERGFLQKDIAARLGVSEKTVSKWECGNGLPEVVFMEPLCRILGITVNELLAGESIPILEMMRSIDRSRLELVKQLEFEQLRMRLYKLYGIEIASMEPSENGAGGLTYFVRAGQKKYVVKYPSDNEMNHPEVEIKVCEKLLSDGIPACRFIPNKQGKMLSSDENGRRFTVQEFYKGITYAYHDAPVRLQKKSAVLLAKIHESIREEEDIPIGIGKEFFVYRKPQYMKDAYEATLQQAIEGGDDEIAKHIRSNMRIIESMEKYEFDINRFSCGNTHGDYMISQLIWDNDEISGVIDFTCACKHPYIWEIVRSYIYMAPEVSQGMIDIECFIKYMESYMEVGTLNQYDIENAGKLFYYFLAVCNFYGQYYESISRNRTIYLEQANMASKLLVWFEKNIDELNKRLRELSMKVAYQKKMSSYYDAEGKLIQYPGKKPMRVIALTKIADCLETDRNIGEKNRMWKSIDRRVAKLAVLYIVIVLVAGNILWYIGYSNRESDDAVFCIVLAQFMPMLVCLFMSRISKEGWNNLGIKVQKKSWKYFLLSIIGSVIIVYAADPLALLLFPNDVSTNFSIREIANILLLTVFGTACFIECLGEELGWIGYLYEKLERLIGIGWACVLLGVIRGIYHLGMIVLMNYPVQMFVEITISNICLSFFMVYLYKKSGSIFACSISHGICNLLPVFLVYEEDWYYTHFPVMMVMMIPSVIYALFFGRRLVKQK